MAEAAETAGAMVLSLQKLFNTLLVAMLLVVGLSTAPAICQADKTEAEKAQCLVVLIYDDSCKHACSVVRPIMENLIKEFDNKVSYVELNIARDHLSESKKVATSLGVMCFLADGADSVPKVGMFKPGRKKCLWNMPGVRKPEVYRKAVVKVLDTSQ